MSCGHICISILANMLLLLGKRVLHFFFLMLRTKGTRNRASPARIVKLYSEMTPEQRTLVQNVGFGGLLSIGCPTLPADITRWLVKNFDTQESQLIISGWGRIAVTADSVQRILGLPAGDAKVDYELNGSAINFINSKYGFREGKAPSITQIADKIKGNSCRWWLPQILANACSSHFLVPNYITINQLQMLPSSSRPE